MCTEFIRTERVKVVGQRYYGLYMSCVQNAVASNKYKCEGYVCNDEIPHTTLKDRQRGRDNKLNKNKLSSHIHTANRRLSVCLIFERTTMSECEFVFVGLYDACAVHSPRGSQIKMMKHAQKANGKGKVNDDIKDDRKCHENKHTIPK